MRKTQKIYYSHQYAKKIYATIVDVDHESRSIELDRTIAYPEGGGQESDHCRLEHLKTGDIFVIDNVKRIDGQDIQITDSHSVNVDGIILHQVSPETQMSLENLRIGDELSLEIDVLRREKLTTSHTASHLLYAAIQKVRHDVIPGIIGCHIKEDQARFDFVVAQRLSEQEMQEITLLANDLVAQDCEITMQPSDLHPDARFWICRQNIIPCGGTHLKKTATVGTLNVKRKNIGKGKERLICMLEKPVYDTEQYVELPTL